MNVKKGERTYKKGADVNLIYIYIYIYIYNQPIKTNQLNQEINLYIMIK